MSEEKSQVTAPASGKKEKKSGRGPGKKERQSAAVSAVQAGRPKSRGVSIPRLEERYVNQFRGELLAELGLKNVMEVPRLEKIVVNVSTKDFLGNSKLVESVRAELASICGQAPRVSKAKKSIATFKLREGQAIGVSVTLRRARMYEFLDRLVNVALPRVRDFKGIPLKSFDGRGNYAFGLKEQIIFPEISYDAVEKVRGMSVVIGTTAATNDQARSLLKKFGLPFRQQ